MSDDHRDSDRSPRPLEAGPCAAPGDFGSLEEFSERLLAFQARYAEIAPPVRVDLHAL